MFLFFAILLTIMLILRLFTSSKPSSSIPPEPRYARKFEKNCGKEVGLTDLARAHPAFRSWCLSLSNSEKSIADKIAEFEQFRELLAKDQEKLVYDFFEKGGATPSWITLASLPVVLSTCSAAAQRAATQTNIAPIYPPLGSSGYLKSEAIKSLYKTTEQSMTLKKLSVKTVTTQAHCVYGNWKVFHPFHPHCKTIHRKYEREFIDINIPIDVLEDEKMWD